jgi:hypothetical protein
LEKHVASIYKQEASFLPASFWFLAWLTFYLEDGSDVSMQSEEMRKYSTEC